MVRIPCSKTLRKFHSFHNCNTINNICCVKKLKLRIIQLQIERTKEQQKKSNKFFEYICTNTHLLISRLIGVCSLHTFTVFFFLLPQPSHKTIQANLYRSWLCKIKRASHSNSLRVLKTIVQQFRNKIHRRDSIVQVSSSHSIDTSKRQRPQRQQQNIIIYTRNRKKKNTTACMLPTWESERMKRRYSDDTHVSILF